MNNTAQLGGGYAESRPDPEPTVEAVLDTARAGSAHAHLAIICGPPGVGKSAAAAQLVESIPHSCCIDKDKTAAGFVLQAARERGLESSMAYGTDHYWEVLRPLEYAGPTALACDNLVGTRLVLLIGGWGPELSVPRLWTGLRQKITPARLSVLHLDAPPLEIWRQRMAARGSRNDSPWFENFAAAVTALPIWEGAVRIPTDRPLHGVIQTMLNALA